MGQEFWQKEIDLVTVGFGNHSEDEIPLGFQRRLHFKLPSQIDKLCFSINPGNFQSFHDYKSEYQMGCAARFNSVDKLRSAIKTAEKNHKVRKKCYYYMHVGPPVASAGPRAKYRLRGPDDVITSSSGCRVS